MNRHAMESIEVTIPVKAGTHMVGATFLATNYRPSLDLIRQYERKSLENNAIPQLQYYPAIGLLRIQGPFSRHAPGGLAQHSQGLHVPGRSTGRSQEEPCAKEILIDAGPARLSASRNTGRIWNGCGRFYQEGRREGTFQDGIELALRRILASPQVSGAHRKRACRMLSRSSPTALPISNWPRVCPSCCGAASRTTN